MLEGKGEYDWMVDSGCRNKSKHKGAAKIFVLIKVLLTPACWVPLWPPGGGGGRVVFPHRKQKYRTHPAAADVLNFPNQELKHLYMNFMHVREQSCFVLVVCLFLFLIKRSSIQPLLLLVTQRIVPPHAVCYAFIFRNF